MDFYGLLAKTNRDNRQVATETGWKTCPAGSPIRHAFTPSTDSVVNDRDMPSSELWFARAMRAGVIAGEWLKYWIEVGAAVSSVGLYSATLSSASYLLAGMAELGHLPSPLAARAPRFGTPWASIAATGAVALGMSFLSFDSIVAVTNFLYGLGMLLEFAAFLWLRARRPGLPRPYRAPAGAAGAAVVCAVPAVFLVLVMAVAGWKVCAAGAGFTAAGVAVYYLMRFCRARGCVEFARPEGEGGERGGCESGKEGQHGDA
jgi:amino acid transporter